MMDLSVIIPARNEQFLSRTVEDLLANIRGDTEIIVVLDGNWSTPPVGDHPLVTLIHHSRSIGQRAACNEAAKYSRAKYIAKCDAHCSFDEGFDKKLMDDMRDDWTIVPVMRNLWAFDWVCPEGHKRYQSPSGPCNEKVNGKECGKPTRREMKWIAKTNPQSTIFVFDPEPHFRYGNKLKERPEYQEAARTTALTETMSLQGSFWMMTRQKYFELGMNDESFGNWGSQGLEIAIRTWTSGGKVMCSHKTWYSHMFRTQGGDFGFPWPCSGRQVESAKKRAKQVFFRSKWGPQQSRPLSWLVERFWPVPYWKDEDLKMLKEEEKQFWTSGQPFSDPKIAEKSMELPESEVNTQEMPSDISEAKPVAQNTASPSKGIVYYSDSQLHPAILEPCQKQLLRSLNGHRLVSVTLKPMEFGENYTLPLERSVLTMFKQILEGIKRCETDIIFFCEHDCLYNEWHFKFIPPRKDVYYYNENQWQVDAATGQALFYHCMRLSTICAYRDLLLEHYTKRVERVEREGFTLRMGYEPGGHRYPRGIDNYTRERFMTPYPLIDLRHRGTVSPNRWKKEHFRNQGPLWSWTEADSVPYWGQTKGRMKEFLEVLKG